MLSSRQDSSQASDAKYYVGLSLLPGIGPVRLSRLIDLCGSAEAAWQAPGVILRRAGVEERAVEGVLARRATIDVDGELDRVYRAGARVITTVDEDYPALLRETFGHPAILYVRGELKVEDSQALAVVGTRRPSLYGQTMVAQTVPALVERGLTIISGLAVGIDTLAHRHALQAGGRTVAVLGSGLDVLYPSQNRGLADRICENGAVITEYAMGTQPDAFNFPARNRIISALALGTVIIEAGYKSGALRTAGYAVEQNREVFAFPGRTNDPQSVGCNRLIKRGHAKLVTDTEDIVDELNLTVAMQQIEIKHVIPENDQEGQILALLSAEPVHVDDLGRRSELSMADISSTLTMLELKGTIRHVGSMHYVLAH
ncbi:MAG TPA: DNA-processing protein DprA [Chloroflexota bacterium]|nr:DNA-processing protein DprA [Chloroflexota bacterium]